MSGTKEYIWREPGILGLGGVTETEVVRCWNCVHFRLTTGKKVRDKTTEAMNYARAQRMTTDKSWREIYNELTEMGYQYKCEKKLMDAYYRWRERATRTYCLELRREVEPSGFCACGERRDA